MIVMNPVSRQQNSVSDPPQTLSRPRWARPTLGALLLVTALLYLWGLGASGWANEYYAAAVQSGTQDWKAMLFGSLDPGNSITVDKPPAALWVMSLSGRLFGFSSWSMLVPQALMGVGTVALLYAAVRRVAGYGAGLLAGAALALTPVAALMFSFNNPDALLVLLLVTAGYCTVRALEGHSTRWIALAGVALGFAFLAKLMQALLIAPALALVVLVAMPGGMLARVRMLAVGLLTLVISGGWYVALVSLWPGDSRPYIGGSTDNSLLQLTLGYNGLGRVFGGQGNHGSGGGFPGGMPGDAGGGGGPAPMRGGFGGSPSITRLFGDAMGTEVSWLLPAALIALVACLWNVRRAPRTDHTRAAFLLWGSWLLVTALVFSFMKGTMHPYYTVALAPAIAAVVGMGVRELWHRRRAASARMVLAVMLSATGLWSWVLLTRTPDWLPWLRWALVIGSVVLAVALIGYGNGGGRWAAALATACLLFGIGGSAAYTIETALTAQSGPMPASGPHRNAMSLGAPGGPGGQPGFGGMQVEDNADLDTLLDESESHWAAATVGSHTAAALELATGRSIMAIGGFSGGDPSPTLEQFQAYVAEGQIHYFVVGKGPGHPGAGPSHGDRHQPGADSGPGVQITQWVQQHFTAQNIVGTEVYDLTAAH